MLRRVVPKVAPTDSIDMRVGPGVTQMRGTTHHKRSVRFRDAVDLIKKFVGLLQMLDNLKHSNHVKLFALLHEWGPFAQVAHVSVEPPPPRFRYVLHRKVNSRDRVAQIAG